MQSQSPGPELVLASSSPYRKILLRQLNIPFETCPPKVDESPLPGEETAALVMRLAREKAAEVARRFPDALVIGSDQLAERNGSGVGKPGTTDAAIAQLQQFSGQKVVFRTAIALMCLASSFRFEREVLTEVRFRRLSNDEIRRYVAADQPLDCAGSFKSESLGISLLDSMVSGDPTAIVGLPLIALSQGLREAGLQMP